MAGDNMLDKWPKLDADLKKIKGQNKIEIHNKGVLHSDFYEYSEKFIKSANIITDNIIKKSDIYKLDFYFFSVAFLYRHGIELILKSIGFKYLKDKSEKIKFIIDTKHNLKCILDYICKYIQNLSNFDLDAYLWLQEFFQDINKIDKESDLFRYPYKISYYNIFDDPYFISPFFNKQTHLNFIEFVNKMEAAYELLSSLYFESNDNSYSYKNYKPIFLEEGGSYYEQSVIGYKYKFKKFHPYIISYSECAELLYKKIKEKQYLKEIFFIPMCYLYRNTIELLIKEIILDESSYFKNSKKIIFENKHKVLRLWNKIKAEIMNISKIYNNEISFINAQNYI